MRRYVWHTLAKLWKDGRMSSLRKMNSIVDSTSIFLFIHRYAFFLYGFLFWIKEATQNTPQEFFFHLKLWGEKHVCAWKDRELSKSKGVQRLRCGMDVEGIYDVRWWLNMMMMMMMMMIMMNHDDDENYVKWRLTRKYYKRWADAGATMEIVVVDVVVVVVVVRFICRSSSSGTCQRWQAA